MYHIISIVTSEIRKYVCLSNLKHMPSRELLLTARKTVFSRLNVLSEEKISNTHPRQQFNLQ